MRQRSPGTPDTCATQRAIHGLARSLTTRSVSEGSPCSNERRRWSPAYSYSTRVSGVVSVTIRMPSLHRRAGIYTSPVASWLSDTEAAQFPRALPLHGSDFPDCCTRSHTCSTSRAPAYSPRVPPPACPRCTGRCVLLADTACQCSRPPPSMTRVISWLLQHFSPARPVRRPCSRMGASRSLPQDIHKALSKSVLILVESLMNMYTSHKRMVSSDSPNKEDFCSTRFRYLQRSCCLFTGLIFREEIIS